MKVQFNARLPKNLIKRVNFDRKTYNQTNDIVLAVALENFFTAYKPDQRFRFYRAHGTPYSRNTKPSAYKAACMKIDADLKAERGGQ